MQLPKNSITVQDGVVTEVNIPGVSSKKLTTMDETEAIQFLEKKGWYQVDLFEHPKKGEVMVFSQEKPVRRNGFLKATHF